MKMKVKIALMILFISLMAATTYSQNDSVKIEYSQEKMTQTNKFDQTICEILTKREKGAKSLWKLNLLQTFFGGFNISYERKITSKWSFNINSVTNINRSFYMLFTPQEVYLPDDIGYGYLAQKLSFESRYYYSLDKRIRAGKKIGFSGNYIGLTIISRYSSFTQANHNLTYNYVNSFINSLNFIYGIQRKIGMVGYIDVSAGLGIGHYNVNEYQYWGVNVPIKLAIGIAF